MPPLSLSLSLPICVCKSSPLPTQQVAREGFVVFFSEVFDAMFRLCADSETNVQNAVQFLDNLVKVMPGKPSDALQLCPHVHGCCVHHRMSPACASGCVD